MTSHRLPARLGVLVTAVGILGLVGVAPASAHTNELFTVVESGDEAYFAQISKTTGVVTPLSEAIPVQLDVDAIEISNQIGYAVGYADEGPSIYTWDHTTGAIGTTVLITQTINAALDIDGVQSLDSLPDGRLVAYLELEDDTEYLVSIDPATGATSELIDLTGASPFLDSIATDPFTGLTLAFVDQDLGMPQFLILEVEDGSFSGPYDLTGVQTSLGNGWFQGADFDDDGYLYFYYSSDVLAVTTGPFSPTVQAEEVADIQGLNIDQSSLAYDSNLIPVNPVPEPEVVPQLADTGLPVDGLLTGAAALIALGLATVFITRRRATV